MPYSHSLVSIVGFGFRPWYYPINLWPKLNLILCVTSWTPYGSLPLRILYSDFTSGYINHTLTASKKQEQMCLIGCYF